MTPEEAAAKAADDKRKAEEKAVAKAAADKAKEAKAAAKVAEKEAARLAKEAEAIKAKAARDAEKAKAQAAKVAAQEKKRAAAEGGKKAKHTQALRELAPIAKEINTRLEKVTELDGKADDHRLAAALRLEDASKLCVTHKINFKKWCDENVTQSYETIRKLVTVGRSADPAKALEDMRGKNREANAAARQRAKEGQATVEGGAAEGSKQPSVAAKPGKVAEAMLALKPEQALKVAKEYAASVGLAVVSETDKKALEQLKKTPKVGGVDSMKEQFTALKASEKMKFLTWAAGVVGAKIDMGLPAAAPVSKETPIDTRSTDELLEIPASLKR